MKNLLMATLLMPLVVFAQTTALKSAAWQSPTIPCATNHPAADLMPLDGLGNWNTQNVLPGAGVWPAGQNLTVLGVCVTHLGNFSGGYAVVGHSGPNGDHVSPYVPNMDTQCMRYGKDAPIVVTGGEYFDVHADCTSGSHYVVLQIWYTQP